MLSTSVPVSVRRDKRTVYAWMVLAFSALAFIPGLKAFGILDPSDGLYAECAREMLDLHNFLTPHFNYTPFLEKPILLYWAIIACYKIFGISEWVARLPSAIAGIACTFSVFAFTRKYIGIRTAAMASMMLLSFPLFVVIGHLALIDMMVALFMTASFLGFFARLEGGSKKILAFAYASLGLLMLAKGPAPALFVVAPAILYLVCLGRKSGESWYQMWWRRALELHPLAGLLIIVAVAGPWYLAENAATHGAFFQEFFVRQNLGRAVGTVNHQEPWNFYIPYITGGMLPWWPILLGGVPVFAGIWRRRHNASPGQRLALLCVCWSAFVIVGCSAIKTKLPTYVIPAWPPVAILSAMTLTLMMRKRQTAQIVIFSLFAALAMVGVMVSPMALENFRHAPALSKIVLILGSVVLVSGMAFCGIMTMRNRVRVGVAGALASSVLATTVLIPSGLHIFDLQHDKPFRLLLADCQHTDGTVAQFMRDAPSVDFYLRKRVPIFYTAAELHSFVTDTPGKHLLIVTDDVLQQAVERAPRLTLLARHSKFSLFCIDP